MALEVQEADARENQYRRAEAMLSKANLLRMRGDLASAELLCAEVLSERPTDGSALAVLAEIRYVQLRYDESLRLFELAHQSGADTPQVNQRLVELRPRAFLPPARARKLPPIVIGVMVSVAFICVAVTAASVAAHRSVDPSGVTVHVVAPPDAPTKIVSEPPKDEQRLPEVVAERAAAQYIELNSWAAVKVLAYAANPRDNTAVVTVTGKGSDERRRIGASAAYTALLFDSSLKSAIVRVVANERIVYVADMNREKIAEIHAAEVQKVPELAEAALINEWNIESKSSGGPSSTDRS